MRRAHLLGLLHTIIKPPRLALDWTPHLFKGPEYLKKLDLVPLWFDRSGEYMTLYEI